MAISEFIDVYQTEAFVLSLFGSLVWASLLLLASRGLSRDASIRGAQGIWIGALLLAIAPSLLAPGLAGFGISLRSAPAATPAPIVEETLVPALSTHAEPAFTMGDLEPLAAATIATPGDEVIVPDDALVAATTIERNAPEQPATSIIPAAERAKVSAFLSASLPKASAIVELSREQWIETIGIIYIYGVALAFLIWLGGAVGLRFVAMNARPVRDVAVIKGVEEWALRLDVPVTPRVRRTSKATSVCVFGIWRPIILIPNDIEARVSQEDIVMMCAHELAHIRRGDTSLFFATAMMRVIFWFNPAVKLITGHVEQAAEEAADATVLRRGVDRRAYAECFVESLRFAAEKSVRRHALTPTFTPFDRHARKQRLDAILRERHRRSASKLSHYGASAAAIAASLGAVAQAAAIVAPESIENRPKFLNFAKADKSDSIAPLDARTENDEFIRPLEGRITLRHNQSINGKSRHKGVDIAAPMGAEIVAPRAGVVVYVDHDHDQNSQYGKVLKIQHAEGVYSKYAHLGEINVSVGDAIDAGDWIANVGVTGDTTGPHLHFEIIENGVSVDPLAQLAMSPLERLSIKYGLADTDEAAAPQAPRLKNDAYAKKYDVVEAFAIGEPIRLAMSNDGAMIDAPAPNLLMDSLKVATGFSLKLADSALATALQPEDPAPGAAPKAPAAPAASAAPTPLTAPAASVSTEMDKAFRAMNAELADAAKRRRTAHAGMSSPKKDKTAIKTTKFVTKNGDGGDFKYEWKLKLSDQDQARVQKELERAEARAEAQLKRDQRNAEREIEMAHANMERERERMEREMKRAERAASESRRRAVAEHKRVLKLKLDSIDQSAEIVENDIVDALAALSEAAANLDDIEMPDQIEHLSRRAIERAVHALSAHGDEYRESLSAAEAKIAEQEAEIARLKKQLEDQRADR